MPQLILSDYNKLLSGKIGNLSRYLDNVFIEFIQYQKHPETMEIQGMQEQTL